MVELERMILSNTNISCVFIALLMISALNFQKNIPPTDEIRKSNLVKGKYFV